MHREEKAEKRGKAEKREKREKERRTGRRRQEHFDDKRVCCRECYVCYIMIYDAMQKRKEE
jgi:hypothetical protein